MTSSSAFLTTNHFGIARTFAPFKTATRAIDLGTHRGRVPPSVVTTEPERFLPYLGGLDVEQVVVRTLGGVIDIEQTQLAGALKELERRRVTQQESVGADKPARII